MKALLMESFEFHRRDNDIVAHNRSLFPEFPLELFNADRLELNFSLQRKKSRVLNVRGRGSIYMFNHDGRALVLRHYYRGGMIARFFHDVYLWQGLYKTRAIAELQMLSVMQGVNLPVPTPVAARIHRAGFTYKADIITLLIPQSRSFSAVLSDRVVSTETWQRVGCVIRQFHDHDCNHFDLNAHNILLNEKGEVFLIDFDKSRIDRHSVSWKQANLARLKRSLTKLKNIEATFHYSEKDFGSLMEGYNG